MSDALQDINHQGKDDDYDLLSHHGAYISQWDL